MPVKSKPKMNELRLQEVICISLPPGPQPKGKHSCYRQSFFNYRMLSNQDFPGKYSKLKNGQDVQEISLRDITYFLLYEHV